MRSYSGGTCYPLDVIRPLDVLLCSAITLAFRLLHSLSMSPYAFTLRVDDALLQGGSDLQSVDQKLV